MSTRAAQAARPSRERGIVVFVALIAMVLLSLAAVALMRSVHTNTMVVGNLAFRQAATSLSSAAVEKAVYDLFPPTRTITDTNHDPLRNYYATHQASDDANGVPAVLRDPNPPACQPPWQVMTDAATGNTVCYVIERMCRDGVKALPEPAGGDWCEMIPPKQPYAKEAQQKKGIPLPKIPYYRMTVRVNGPGNSVAFSQAMLR